MRRKVHSILAAGFVAVAAGIFAGTKPPNIIFILADDLGHGDVGFTRAQGECRIRTPNLDKLAHEGVILTGHYCAAPVCAPSRASLITGRIQGKCSLSDNCFDRPFAETNTIGSILHDAGYATWAVGKWGVAGGGESGLPVSSHPLDRGFDYYYGFLDHMAGHTYYHYRGNVRGAFMGITENRADATDSATGIYSTDLFAAKAKQLIERHVAEAPQKPFFLFLAVNTIHGSGFSDDSLKNKTPLHVPGGAYPALGVNWPLQPEAIETRNTYIAPEYANLPANAARYATAITRLDDAVGDLMATVKRLGIDGNTLLVFTSDNGPADEYGADPLAFGSNAPFDGLKRDVFEGGMRVPTFMRWPDRIAPGSVDNAPSQFHDWMATLADAARAPKPPECEGVSLLGAYRLPSLVYTQYYFPAQAGSSRAFREFAGRKGKVRGLQQMVRLGDYVALRTHLDVDPAAPVQLYNVAEDPFEEHNLAGEDAQKPRLEEMTRILDERLAK